MFKKLIVLSESKGYSCPTQKMCPKTIHCAAIEVGGPFLALQAHPDPS